MDIKLQEELFKKYPKIFVQKDLSIKETCMCWGFDCGDGWYWLIDRLCESMQNYIDANDKEQVEATQVKEKYGGMSFYTIGGDELIQGMIWLAETMSTAICEKCGSTTEVTPTEGWIKTLCSKCHKKD